MRSSPDNGSSWSAVRTLHDYSAKPKPKPKPNPSPSPSPSPRPSPNQVRTLHNYSGVVSGYVAPTVDHRSGAVLLFFNVNYTQAAAPPYSPSPSPSRNPNPKHCTQTWLRRSVDDGASWSAAINRTAAVGPLALGAGVQLPDLVRVRVS